MANSDAFRPLDPSASTRFPDYLENILYRLAPWQIDATYVLKLSVADQLAISDAVPFAQFPQKLTQEGSDKLEIKQTKFKDTPS